ncbi:MAG: DUF3137 domain-containing protein [Saprospiraceae bacterium]
MNQQDRFRVYYNHTIHPELVRMERLRLRLLRLLAGSVLLLLALLAFEFYIGEFVVFVAFSIPITLYVSFLLYRVRQFIQTFKPRIMNLVLAFIEEFPNVGKLYYESAGYIPREVFEESGLFLSKGQVYRGEDRIHGEVGEMGFELSELRVEEMSLVGAGMSRVFRGVFLHAVFSEEAIGRVAIWPRRKRQFCSRAIREFTREGGVNADAEILNPAFREMFMTYATKATHVAGILSEPTQEAIVRYSQATGKDFYLSFIGREIFIAVDEDRDILEPRLFRSNVHFELVRGYLNDILLLLNIIEDFDKMH